MPARPIFDMKPFDVPSVSELPLPVDKLAAAEQDAAEAVADESSDENPFVLSTEPMPPLTWPVHAPAAVEDAAVLRETALPVTPVIYLVACDPRRLFAYWDINWADFGPADQPRVRLCRPDGHVLREVAIQHSDSGHYDAGDPGQTYLAEIGIQGPLGWRALAQSAPATLPPAGPAPANEPAAYATLPWAMDFGALREAFTPLAEPDEGLAETVARVQDSAAETGNLDLTDDLFTRLTPEQRASLESVLQSDSLRQAWGALGGGSEWPLGNGGPGEASGYAAALAALRQLLEFADAASHAPAPGDALVAQWALWRRTVRAQLDPVASSVSSW